MEVFFDVLTVILAVALILFFISAIVVGIILLKEPNQNEEDYQYCDCDCDCCRNIR